jgi:hypothetical protein
LPRNPLPGAFNHNSGLNDAGNVLFTTDEVADAPLAAFDVSDLENITLLDTYKPTRKPTGEVHNVRVIRDFLVNPSYRGQLTIVDATQPDNMVEIGWDSLGTSLVWDADAYLPSGIIFATAKKEGLFARKNLTTGPLAVLKDKSRMRRQAHCCPTPKFSDRYMARRYHDVRRYLQDWCGDSRRLSAVRYP